MDLISKQLVELRIIKKLSQEELANELGVSRQAISKWETGSGYPETDNLIKLVSFYDTSADYILFGKKDKKKESIFSDQNFVKALIFFGMIFGIISFTAIIITFFIR
jgi:transcriptional regulator with XRE-family HTH domain